VAAIKWGRLMDGCAPIKPAGRKLIASAATLVNSAPFAPPPLQQQRHRRGNCDELITLTGRYSAYLHSAVFCRRQVAAAEDGRSSPAFARPALAGRRVCVCHLGERRV
jgi:hypothetical protein